MKTTRIIAIGLIVVAASIIYTSLSGASRYADFSQAFGNPGQKYTVIGKLNREKSLVDIPNRLEFYVIDEKGEERKVIYHKTKPQDFERSEKIVMTGKVDKNDFIATELLLKCPSKYNKGNN